MVHRHPYPGFQYRCVVCNRSVIVRSPLAPSRSLCSDCAATEPGGWRMVYDRDKGLGEVPPNLKVSTGPA